MKKIKSILKQREPRNQFDVSYGNLRVLESIPFMMCDEKFRKRLRFLYFEFLIHQKRKRMI
jgi:hypothetical protein